MLSLGSERLHKQIEDVLGGRDAARRTGWRLYLNGEDYSERVKEGGYETEDGPAIVLDIDVGGFLPESIEGEEAYMEWLVDGIPVSAFTGVIADVIGGPVSTVRGASPGEALPRIELGSRVEYGGVNPSTAMNDALLRVERYSAGMVRVERVERLKFHRQGRDAYSATDFAGDIIESVQTDIPRLVHYDTSDGGCRAFLAPNLADMPEPVWTFEVGRDVKKEDFEDGREEDLYREVIVRRPVSNPAVGADPWEVLSRVEVAGSKAPLGTIKRIDVSDEATDLSPFFQQAHDEATSQAYRIGRISWTAVYVHPLLERGDVAAIMVPRKDSLGEYVERWLCVLDDACCPEVRRKRGRYGGIGRVVETTRPERFGPSKGLTPGVVPA